jgi:hypothetical protein
VPKKPRKCGTLRRPCIPRDYYRPPFIESPMPLR